MNERLKQLYSQAHALKECLDDGAPRTVYWKREFCPEKFAELIVRECAAQLDDGAEDGAWARSVLYRHFGVKE